jgi:hypothetical protein
MCLFVYAYISGSAIKNEEEKSGLLSKMKNPDYFLLVSEAEGVGGGAVKPCLQVK